MPPVGGLTGLRNVQTLQRRMIADVVRRVAVRHLPGDLAAIQVDRRDGAVRRLENRQALDERVRPPQRPPPRGRRAAPQPRRGATPAARGSRRLRLRLRDRARRISGAAVARSEHFDERPAGDARHVADVREVRRRRHDRRCA